MTAQPVRCSEFTTTLNPSAIPALHLAAISYCYSMTAAHFGKEVELYILETGHMSFCCIKVTVKAVAVCCTIIEVSYLDLKLSLLVIEGIEGNDDVPASS